jgi:hypothetical protein
VKTGHFATKPLCGSAAIEMLAHFHEGLGFFGLGHGDFVHGRRPWHLAQTKTEKPLGFWYRFGRF